MKIVIIEDEQMAAQALERLVREVIPNAEIAAVLQSIDESVEWFGTARQTADLVFMDIHLADGSSFAIFDRVEIPCPIIFTTAYDQYALKAFEVNSIDYLLKPIDKSALERAVNKLREFRSGQGAFAGADPSLVERLIAGLKQGGASYRTSLLVARKDKLIPLSIKEIAFIHIETKIVRAYTFAGDSYVLEQTMEELAESLDPALFFRANRQFIIARGAVKDMSVWFGGKLSVNLSVAAPERLYVSKARVKEFKKWITG